MSTKIVAALLAILTALGGLNLFQSIKQKLVPQANIETLALAESDGMTITDDGRRIVFRTAATTVETDVEVDTDFDFAFDFDIDTDDGEVMISEHFDVKRGATLIVDVSHADVDIVTGSGDEAHVEVTLDSNRRFKRAKEQFEKMNWRVSQEDGDVVLMADDLRGWNNISLDIDVTVHIPSEFNIDLQTSHGDIDLGHLEGEVSIVTSHGDVDLDDVKSRRIWVKSSHGDIEGGLLSAGVIEVQTSHADIEIEAIDSEEFVATTSHADVEIGNLTGASRIRKSHGDVFVELADDLGAEITTQHGDVEVSMTSGARMDLDLQASDIEISSRMNIKVLVSEDEVDAELNGGGALLKARTTHGDISIR